MEQKSKKICFFDTPKRHIDLKLRIQYDGFKFSEFMRILITGYLEKDERIISFIQEAKRNAGNQNKKKLKQSEKMNEKAKENIDKFALNEDEIESIFDMIEQEYEEL